MAQVIRKYQKAGTFGNIIIDGKKHKVTEDWLNAIEHQSEQGRAWAQQIRSGNDRYLNTTEDGYDFMESSDSAAQLGNLNERQEKKIGLAGRGGRKVRQEREHWHNLGNFIMNSVAEHTPKPTEWSLKALDLPYYLNDEDNATKYLTSGDTVRLDEHIKKLNTLQNNFDKYTFWKEGVSRDEVLALLANNKNVTQLVDDIKKGNLTEEVLRNASLLGINVRNGESAASPKTDDLRTDSADADSITFKSADGQNIGMFSADGKLNTTHPLYDYIKQNPTGTYFFGENYRRFNPNSSIKEDFFYRNGRLHKATDSEIINSGDYINWTNLLKQGKYSEANSLIPFDWAKDIVYHPVTTDAGTLLYAPEGAHLASDVTGYYDGGEGNRVVRFLSPNTQTDSYGFPIMNDDQLMVIDANNNRVQKEPVKRATPISWTSNLGYQPAMENPFTEDLGMPIYNVISAGNPNNMSIIKVGDKYYYYDRGYDVLAKSGSGLGSTNKYAVEIPKDWVSAIQQNPALLRNSELRKKLNQIIYSRIRPGGVEYNYETRTIDPGFANRNYTGFDDQFSIFLPTQSTVIPEANKIQFKQSGGILSSGDNSTLTAMPVLKTDQKVRGAGESKVLRDGTQLTATDKAELASLFLDVAGLGVSFIPVYGNIAGAVLGLGGTTAQAVADIRKDGLDWGDVGRLGLNVGFDLMSLFSGPIGKSGKLAKSLITSNAVAKAVSLAIAGAGTASAANSIINSWDRLKKGEWKIDDLRNILNVVRGVQGVSRLAGSAKKTSIPESTTAKIGNTEATITKKEWDRIKKLPISQQKEQLEQLLPTKQPSLEEAQTAVKTLRKQNNTDLEKDLEKAAQDYIKAHTERMNLEEAGISYRPAQDKWYKKLFKPESLQFTPEFTSAEVYIDPKSVPWYKPWNKYAATMNKWRNPKGLSEQELDRLITRYISIYNKPPKYKYLPVTFRHINSVEDEQPTPTPYYLYQKGGKVATGETPRWLNNLQTAKKVFDVIDIGGMINDAARTANVLNSARKIRDYKNDAVRKQGLAMKTLLPYKTETYNFDPILKAYDDQKSSVMDAVDPIIKTQTDAKLAGQVRLAEADKLIEIGDNVRKSMSEEISRKDAINRENHYKTDLENIARTDDNRRLGAEVASQVANNEAEYTASKAAEINNILTEKQQRRAIGQQERAKVASLTEYNKALNDAQTKFSNLPKNISDDDKASYSNYLKNTLNEINTTSEYNNSYNRNTYLRNDVFSSKPSILDFDSWKRFRQK